ncbi:MAG: cytochrome P450 [Gemmatimonadaceae bacterium]
MTVTPGPRGRELLRTMLGRRNNPVRMFETLRDRYGEIVRVKVGDTSNFIVSGVDAAKHVLVDNHRNYSKGPAYELLAAILGEGLITSEGEHWRRHRRIVQPALQKERMHAFVSIMAHAATVESRRLQGSGGLRGTVDVFPSMMDLALRIVARALLGTGVEGKETEIERALTEVLDHIERLSVSRLRLLELLPWGSRFRDVRKRIAMLPTKSNRRFRDAVASLDTLIYDVIARRRAALSAHDEPQDLVGQLLLAKDDGANALTDVEIRDEVMTMFLAGHETTATSLSWCLHLLATHEKEQTAVARESIEVLGGRDPQASDLPQLRHARAVFDEAMRLYPPVWRISRFAREQDSIDGHEIPRGSVVVVATYLLHRDPRYWDRPAEFDPARFSPESAGQRPRLAFMPFGAGQRMCIGAAFATAEAQVILSMLCRKLVFEPASGAHPEFEPRVTLRPKGGLPLRVRTRESWAGAK